MRTARKLEEDAEHIAAPTGLSKVRSQLKLVKGGKAIVESEQTLHYGQDRLLFDATKPWHVIVAGVRYGKTLFGPKWHYHRVRKNRFSRESLVIAPTNKLLKLVNLPQYVLYLQSIGLKEGIHFKVNRSPIAMHITLFKTKSRVEHKVIFLSGDNPDSIVAYTASHCWIDEAALMLEEVKRRARMRVSCPKAEHRKQILATSTPEGENWFYESFGPANSDRIEGSPFSEGPKVLVLHGSSFDNPYLDEDYLQQLRDEFEFDDAYYRNYILGEWVSLSKNKFYFCFSQSFNATEKLKLDEKNKNLYLTFDFNVGKTSWAVIQEQPRETLAKHVYCVLKANKANARNVQEACEQFKTVFPPERFKDYRFVLLGDSYGHNRSEQTFTTAFRIIMSILEKEYSIRCHAPHGNPFVAERSICTNRLFSQGRLLIDPSCTEVIKSAKMSESDGKDGIKKPKGPDGDTITHPMEAIDMALMVLEPSEFVSRGGVYNRFG